MEERRKVAKTMAAKKLLDRIEQNELFEDQDLKELSRRQLIDEVKCLRKALSEEKAKRNLQDG